MTLDDAQIRWPYGTVRGLLIDPDQPRDKIELHRPDMTIFYVLVMHPSHEANADAIRDQCETSPFIGGLFSNRELASRRWARSIR